MRRIGIAALLVLIVAPAHAQREAEGLSASIRKATARVAPAVVSIRPLGIIAPQVVVPPFVRMGRLPIPRARVERMPSGSGVVVDAKRGLVATSGQVLRGSMQAEVVLADGSIRPALRINAAAPPTDLVLIEIDPKGTEVSQVEWADSRTLQLGDWVVAVGRSAMGKSIASAGIVSATVDQAEAGSELEPIQTDALVTAETAGGPLVNLDGQVVGISQARGDFVGGDPRDGFRTAIPETLVRKLAGEFHGDGKVRHGYLGVTLNPDGRRSQGTIVTSVSPGSPAAEAGLAPGDRIVSVDGRAVRDAQALSRAVEMTPVGQELTLVIERQGKKFEAKVRTQPRPDAFDPTTIESVPSSEPSLDPLDEPEPKAAPAPPEPEKSKSDLPPAILEGPKAKTNKP
ncbi:S1C family serine protease [Paludisphaera borealis]|uniref:Periplasmic serine endoprotease DegP n=1 Tax=Paludisphaera borealis TaxID=1387353 RepID=A0A1U7CM87_9BACT|nr:trypsin-like peptidase domain-containing protein [Paludisphaera borealis]APW60026.1 Periplasmic serine endoprotease DegP [Paludisphaera borealis]